MTAGAMRVGLISDTHGLLRPEAVAYLSGSDHILHAGDIGDASVLEALQAIAPVTAVRGNNDRGPWARSIAETEMVRFDASRCRYPPAGFISGAAVQARLATFEVPRK